MVKQIGWFHEIIQGNFFSAAYLGDAGLLRKHINFFSERFRTLIPVEMNSSFDMPNTIDALDGSGMGALHWAVLKGHEICVRILLDRGADVDLMQKGCNSPLLLAAAGGQETLARLLIDRGASVYTRNHKGHDVVFMSVLFGHATKGLPWLIQLFNSKGLDLNRVDSQGATPLHLCAERNLSRPIRMLVDSGADVNAKHGRTQLTPLQIACSHAYPDVETIRSFLDKGAYPNWKDLQGRTALQLIVWKYNPNSHGNSPNPFKSSVIFTPQGSRVDVQMLMSPNGEAPDSSENTSRDSFRMSSAVSPVGRDSERWRPMEDTIVQVGDWAVRCLPVVLELCKKGARYNSKDIEHLRPSFRAAISEAHEKWEDIKAPANFVEFITVREQSGEELRLHKVHWNKDKSSTSCQLCDDNFKLTNRRHHCRACGALVCDTCSVKRLALTITTVGNEVQSGGSGKHTPSGGVSKGKESKKSGKDANDDGPGANGEERVCDGCFNRLVHEATQPTLDTFRIRQLKQCAMDLIASVDELIDSLDNMPNSNSNRPGANGNNSAYFQEMLDLASQLDAVNIGGSSSKGPGSVSGSSVTSGYSTLSTPTTASTTTASTTPTTASNRPSKRFSLSRLGSRLTSSSTPTTPPPPSMTTPPPPPSSASSASGNNAAYLANQQQLIEALRTREQRLYRVQDIVMKFLDVSPVCVDSFHFIFILFYFVICD
jgi:ankyrin repeat protein